MQHSLDIPVVLLSGNDCGRCRDRLKEGLGRLAGVQGIVLTQGGESFSVRYDPALISAPRLREEARRIGARLGENYAHRVLEVRGLDCADCAATVEKMLTRRPGVLWAAVNVAAGSLEVEYDPGRLAPEELAAELRKLGYASSQEAEHRHSTVFYIPEMDCDEEIALIRAKLGALPGVDDLDFNLVAQKLTVMHRSSPEALAQALREIHMTPRAEKVEEAPPPSFWQRRQRLILTAASGLLTLLGFALALAGSPRAVSWPLYGAAILSGGWLMARKAWFAVRSRSLDINVLMTLAVVGALAIGDWLEGATVIVLFALANLLESLSMERARRSIKALMDLKPPTARVRRDGVERDLPVSEVEVGEVVSVRPGERIPLDGTVIEGASAVDQSSITGESMPVDKGLGDALYGGTINGQGYLELSVSRPAADTALARIIHGVEEAQSRKAPSQGFVDRFARVYTPAVVLAAVLLAVLPPLVLGQAWGVWFYRALVLLVVACPCALVISTPVTIVSGLARATREGILMKGGVCLENLAGIPVFAFDKTGTLTEGRPRVSGVHPLGGARGAGDAQRDGGPQEAGGAQAPAAETEVLLAAAAVEARSEHPLAGAILAHARERGMALPEAGEFRSLPGRGASAVLDGRRLFVGNHRLFEEMGWCSPPVEALLERLESEGQTAVLVGRDGQVLGAVSVADRPRQGARRALAELKRAGVRHTLMLTGDNRATARAVAAELGMDEVRAELLPQDKVDAVRELAARHGGVAMVGDGVNDAPALAAATVGIAMGAAGADAALETADVALMSDDLTRLPAAVRLSRRVGGIVRQNIIFALLVKVVFIALTPLGFTSLWLAVAADMGASLLVIFNGLRALRRAR
jgi:Cd2+/Zn2+-exporting ATPase